MNCDAGYEICNKFSRKVAKRFFCKDKKQKDSIKLSKTFKKMEVFFFKNFPTSLFYFYLILLNIFINLIFIIQFQKRSFFRQKIRNFSPRVLIVAETPCFSTQKSEITFPFSNVNSSYTPRISVHLLKFLRDQSFSYKHLEDFIFHFVSTRNLNFLLSQ